MWEKVILFIKNFFPEFFTDLFWMLLKIVIIITIIMVTIEILKALKVLDFLNKLLYSITRFLGISKNASTPLLIGILLGITYGAGAILSSYANKDMNKKDVVLVSVFLCICHAIVEDTLIFVALGAKGWLLVIIRFCLAYGITMVVNLIYHPKQEINSTTISLSKPVGSH